MSLTLGRYRVDKVFSRFLKKFGGSIDRQEVQASSIGVIGRNCPISFWNIGLSTAGSVTVREFSG